MDPQYSIIIVNWNTGSLLTDCILSVKASFQENDSTEAEILVIDNASTDQSLIQARTTFSDIQVIESSSNLGFGSANNLAARQARGEFLLFLNPDTLMKPGAIQLLKDHLESSPQVGAVGPKLLNPDGSVQLSIFRTPTLTREAWRLFHLDRIFPYNAYPAWLLSSTEPQEVDILQGTCLLVRRDVFFSIGQFDERFFMYSEEVDLCVRIRSAGWSIQWLPQALVIHLGGQSTKLVADQMFLMLYRNKVEFFRKHYGQPDTALYKMLLYLVSLSRYFPGALLKAMTLAKSQAAWDTSRQYGLMLKEISSF
jgi:N-acetylglucosaminyl-diphospho-decaprenol L-rhamnosyltransferase